jgi:hypothetical protein
LKYFQNELLSLQGTLNKEHKDCMNHIEKQTETFHKNINEIYEKSMKELSDTHQKNIEYMEVYLKTIINKREIIDKFIEKKHQRETIKSKEILEAYLMILNDKMV